MHDLIQILKALCGEEDPALFGSVLDEVKKAIAFEIRDGEVEVDTKAVLRLGLDLEYMLMLEQREYQAAMTDINLADTVQDPKLKKLLSQEGVDDRYGR